MYGGDVLKVFIHYYITYKCYQYAPTANQNQPHRKTLPLKC